MRRSKRLWDKLLVCLLRMGHRGCNRGNSMIRILLVLAGCETQQNDVAPNSKGELQVLLKRPKVFLESVARLYDFKAHGWAFGCSSISSELFGLRNHS